MGFDAALDRYAGEAQQIVTLLLSGDRARVGEIVTQHKEPRLLALLLADLCAYVQHAHARIAWDGSDSWHRLLVQAEAFRSISDGED